MINFENLHHGTVDEALNLRPEDDRLHKHLGIHDVWWDDGDRAWMKMTVTEPTLNPMGMVHGGSIFALCDMAAEACIITRGRMGVTLNGNIRFYRPAKPGAVLTAMAEKRKSGRRTAVCVVRVTDEKERDIAEAGFTLFYTD